MLGELGSGDFGEREPSAVKGSGMMAKEGQLFLLEVKKRYFCNCKTSNLCAIM
jgi:hypothetical protein